MTDYNLPPGVTTRDLPGNGPEPTEAHQRAARAKLLANVEQFAEDLAADCGAGPNVLAFVYPVEIEHTDAGLRKAGIPKLVSVLLASTSPSVVYETRNELRRRFVEANNELLWEYAVEAMEGDQP